jgi:hypothetical protein
LQNEKVIAKKHTDWQVWNTTHSLRIIRLCGFRIRKEESLYPLLHY